MKIAINGMGRMGRLLFRRLINNPQFEIVAINDIMDPHNLAYLLQYDSVYGKFDQPISYKNKLIVDSTQITCLSEPDPLKLPWKTLKPDIILECTGMFTSRQLALHHITAGAAKVILSTTGSDDIPLVIFGYNTPSFHRMDIISPGGCMTNCATHIIDLMSPFGIESVHINVMHSYTSRQQLVDAPHKDFRRGRAAAESIIPVPVDLAQSLEILFPSLKNKIASISTRIPVANGALADFTFHLSKQTTKKELNHIFKTASATTHNGILEFTEQPIVSLDIKSNIHSSIVDGTITSVVGNQAKIFAFFDNEFGYTSRIIDFLNLLSTKK